MAPDMPTTAETMRRTPAIFGRLDGARGALEVGGNHVVGRWYSAGRGTQAAGSWSLGGRGPCVSPGFKNSTGGGDGRFFCSSSPFSSAILSILAKRGSLLNGAVRTFTGTVRRAVLSRDGGSRSGYLCDPDVWVDAHRARRPRCGPFLPILRTAFGRPSDLPRTGNDSGADSRQPRRDRVRGERAECGQDGRRHAFRVPPQGSEGHRGRRGICSACRGNDSRERRVRSRGALPVRPRSGRIPDRNLVREIRGLGLGSVLTHWNPESPRIRSCIGLMGSEYLMNPATFRPARLRDG